MPPPILNSTLITIPILNTILASPAAHPSINPSYRVQVLTTKLAILTNRPSQPSRMGFDAELEIMQCRLDLAKAAMHSELKGKNLVLAEGELGVVERQCKGLTKRLCREARVRSDKTEENKKRIGKWTDASVASAAASAAGGSGSRAWSGGSGSGSEGKNARPELKRTSSTTSSSSNTDSLPDITEENDYDYTSTESTPTQPPLSPPIDDIPSLSLHSLSLSPSDLNGPDAEEPSPFFRQYSTSNTKTSRVEERREPRENKYELRRRVVQDLRIQALILMAEVEEMMGRPERRGKWDNLALKLSAGSSNGSAGTITNVGSSASSSSSTSADADLGTSSTGSAGTA
jgi:hypothetical protein